MGLLTTERMDKAAPPRVSPSNLVSTTPLKSSRFVKFLRRVHAPCPRHRAHDEQDLLGIHRFLIDSISFIICSSIANRPQYQ